MSAPGTKHDIDKRLCRRAACTVSLCGHAVFRLPPPCAAHHPLAMPLWFGDALSLLQVRNLDDIVSCELEPPGLFVSWTLATAPDVSPHKPRSSAHSSDQQQYVFLVLHDWAPLFRDATASLLPLAPSSSLAGQSCRTDGCCSLASVPLPDSPPLCEWSGPVPKCWERDKDAGPFSSESSSESSSDSEPCGCDPAPLACCMYVPPPLAPTPDTLCPALHQPAPLLTVRVRLCVRCRRSAPPDAPAYTFRAKSSHWVRARTIRADVNVLARLPHRGGGDDASHTALWLGKLDAGTRMTVDRRSWVCAPALDGSQTEILYARAYLHDGHYGAHWWFVSLACIVPTNSFGDAFAARPLVACDLDI